MSSHRLLLQPFSLSDPSARNSEVVCHLRVFAEHVPEKGKKFDRACSTKTDANVFTHMGNYRHGETRLGGSPHPRNPGISIGSRQYLGTHRVSCIVRRSSFEVQIDAGRQTGMKTEPECDDFYIHPPS